MIELLLMMICFMLVLLLFLVLAKNKRINHQNSYEEYVRDRRTARRRARNRRQDENKLTAKHAFQKEEYFNLNNALAAKIASDTVTPERDEVSAERHQAESMTKGIKGVSPLAFRCARMEDLPEIMALFKETAENLREKGIEQWQHWLNPEENYKRWVEKGITNSEYFFVEKAGKTAGMFRLMYTDEEYWGKTTDEAAYVHSLVTKTEYAGQKLGAQVLNKIEKMVLAQDITRLRLDCKADNTALCAYYVAHGFLPVRVQEMPHYTVQLFEKILDLA